MDRRQRGPDRGRERRVIETADAEITGHIDSAAMRSEEHTSELQSLMRISYAVFCLKKKNTQKTSTPGRHTRYMAQPTYKHREIQRRDNRTLLGTRKPSCAK